MTPTPADWIDWTCIAIGAAYAVYLCITNLTKE